MNYEMRFEYASYRSREKAETSLESMFAAGEVSAGDSPLIEKRGVRWVITMKGA